MEPTKPDVLSDEEIQQIQAEQRASGVLSDEQISQLLAQARADGDPVALREAVELARAAQEARGAAKRNDQRMIKIYDFKRPDKFSKDQTRVIQMMHESFARLTTTALSAQVRSLVHVHVASVDQLTYEEFIRSIPNPTTLARIDMDPLKGEAILEIDPAVTYTLVDRLFGGGGQGYMIARELTSIECAVLEGVLARILGGLREAWSVVVDLRPRLGGIETNPQFAQIVPPTEMVVLVTLETRIGDVEGMMNFCIPYLTIQDIVPRLSQAFYYSVVRRFPAEVLPSISDLPVGLEVYYEGEKLSLGAISRLRRGSLVRMPRYAEGKAFLRAGGASLYRVDARRVRGRRDIAYTLADREKGTADALFLGRRKRAPEAEANELQLAMQSFSTQVSGAVKSLEEGVARIARRQEELQEQLMFQSPEKALPPAEEPAGEKMRRRPFDFLTISVCEPLAALLGGEHPQTIALVLSHLDPGLAACVLAGIPEELQAEVAGRIAMMERTLPEVLRTVERVLEAQMKVVLSSDYVVTGGIDSIVGILNVASRALEKHIIGSIEKNDKELAEAIKTHMLVFEDLVLLEPKDLRTVLENVSEEDLITAFKGVEDSVRLHICAQLPHDKAEAVPRKMVEMGSVRLRHVDEAQQRIVATVRRLEEQGEIVIGRPGEGDVVG